MASTNRTPESNRLDWRDYWPLVIRRRWFLMGPFFAIGLMGFLAALVWPVRYRSDALILVEQQKVPEQYVTPNVVITLEERLQGIRQQILSRGRLQQLIEHLGLFSQERNRTSMDSLIERLRKDISIEPGKESDRPGEFTTLHISYDALNPETAQRVVSELTSLFIEENFRARSQQSESTTKFLEDELEAARQNLAGKEQQLREYKSRYLGELPEQEQTNLQSLSSLQAQFGTVSSALDRAEQEKTYLESMQMQYRSMGPALGGGDSTGGLGPAPLTLKQLRGRLAELEARYTPKFPDVVRVKKQIDELEARQRRGKAQSGEQQDSSYDQPSAGAEEPQLAEIQSRLKANRMEIQSRKKQLDGLRRRIQQFQSRLDLTPIRQEEFSTVMRDYDNARQDYQSLLQKKNQSELATNLEKRQQGEQFWIVEPATLPEKPVQPNRAQIVLAAWFLGLVGGIGLTGFQEATDVRLRGEEDVTSCSKLPVLAAIPVWPSPLRERQMKRRRSLELAGVAVLVLLSAVSAFYSLLVG